MKSFQANIKKDTYFTIGFAILLAIIIPLFVKVSVQGWILLSIFLLAFLLTNILATRLTEIRIDEANNTLFLIYGNYFSETTIRIYKIQEIEFTYKRQKTSFRGEIKNVCSIYFSDKKVVQLIPGDDGWDDDEVFSLVHELIYLGVERKFVGYQLKDVNI